MQRRQFLGNALSVALSAAGGIAAIIPWRSGGVEGSPPLRPPGALSESDFVSRCIRCMRCMDACPNHALLPMPLGSTGSASGTPTLRPRKAACMLCASEPGEHLRCTEVCPSGALQLVRKEREEIRDRVRIGTAELDLDLCYSYNNWSCGACFRACPLAGEAMTLETWERPIVHADACVGCGLCERACIRYPHAIRVKSRGGA